MNRKIPKFPESPKAKLRLLFAVGLTILGCEATSPEDLEAFLSSKPQASTITSASVAFSPPALNFGSVSSLAKNSTQNITVNNRATISLYLDVLTPQLASKLTAGKEVFAVSGSNCPTAGQPLLPAESCSFTVKISPSDAVANALETEFILPFSETPGAFNLQSGFKATAQIEQDSPNIGNAALTFSPSVYEFPRSVIGETSYKEVTLSNASTVNIAVKEFSGVPSPFTLDSEGCAGNKATLAPGQKCLVKIGFSPKSMGSAAATMQVSYQTGSAQSTLLTTSMGLTGSSLTIGNAAITFDPASVDFGAVRVGTGEEVRTVQLVNTSSSKLYLKDIVGFDKQFTEVLSNCPKDATALQPSASCDLTLKFSPQLTGSLAANVIVNYDMVAGKSGFNSSIGLTGSGVGLLNFAGASTIGPDDQNTTSQLKVNWLAATGGEVSRYYVYRISAGQKIYVADVGPKVNSYTETGLKAATSYSYLVKASDVLGVPDTNTQQLSVTTDPLGTFSSFTTGSAAEGSTVVSSNFSCTNNHSESSMPVPSFSIAAQSDADANCAIIGSGPYQLSCTPAFKAGHTNWTSDITVRCTLNGSTLDQTLSLSVNDTNRAPVLDAIASTNILAETAMTPINAGQSAQDLDADGDVLTYACAFDTTVDGNVSAGTPCASLPAVTVTFDSSTGLLTWTPSVAAAAGGSGAYEIKITASDGRPAPLSDSKIFVATVNGTVVTGVTSNTVNGTFKIGDTIDVRVTFSGTVTVTGSPYLALETGASDAQATYASGSGFHLSVQLCGAIGSWVERPRLHGHRRGGPKRRHDS